MLYLMIDGEPKCQSARLRDAEALLFDADPNLYEVIKKVTCAYPPEPVHETQREMAVHNLHRALGADAEIIWVDHWTHADALEPYECYRAR